jgi:hypothetical protein
LCNTVAAGSLWPNNGAKSSAVKSTYLQDWEERRLAWEEDCIKLLNVQREKPWQDIMALALEFLLLHTSYQLVEAGCPV